MAENKVSIKITAEDLASAVIQGVNQAMGVTSATATKTGKDMQESAQAGIKSFSELLTPLRQIPLAFNQTVQMAQSLWQGLMSLAEPAMVMDKLNTQFKAASGSAQAAAKDLQFVRDISGKLGLAFQDSAAGFAKFSASVRGTSIEGEKAKQVFTGVAEASTALRLSADETNGILLAFSQMMGKGRISAEELNQVGERLPGALDTMARSMNMTTTEFRNAAEEGRILSAELMTKVGPALSSLYGDAAKDAAAGPAAQLNRLKNAVFELGAVIGAGPMQAVGNLASALSYLAEAAKNGLAWLSDEKTGASSWAGLAFAINTVTSTLTPIAAALGVAAAGYAAYSAAAAFAASATGAFTLALLSSPLFLAGAAIVMAAVAAIKLLGDTLNGTAESSAKAGKAIAETTEAQRKQAAEAKQLQDEYDKAFGASLARQLAKREQQYQDDLKMLDKKLALDLQKTGLSEDQKQQLTAKYIADKLKLGELYYQDAGKMRDEERKKEQAAYDVRINDYIAFLKLMGRQNEADDQTFARKLQKERQQLLDEFARREADAKANGTVLVGFEAEKQAAIDALQKRQFAEANRRGLDRQQTDIDLAKKTADVQIAEIKRRVAEHLLTEEQAQAQILQIQQATLQQQLDIARQKAATWTIGSDQYKKALGDIAAAEAALTDNITSQHKLRETTQQTSLSNQLLAVQNYYQADLNNLQEAENNKSLTAQEAQLRRLKLERDRAEEVASIHAAEVVQYQEGTKEYEAAVKARLDADKAYLTAKQAVLKEEAKQFAEITARHSEELKARLDAERASLEQSRAFAQGWFGIWDDAYNKASASLQSLSAAAYNTFAELEGRPLKAVESLETLKQKAEEASANYAKLYREAKVAGLQVMAAWSDAYERLNMIPAKVEQITAEYYKQKVAAEELAIALQQPSNATAAFIYQTEKAMAGLQLLDDSSLDKLRSGIDKIKTSMMQFTERVIDSLKELQNEWDSMTLSKVELEEKRYQQERVKWQKDYDLAKQQGNQDAIKALNEQLALMEKIKKANIALLKENPDNLVAPKIPGMASGGRVGGTGTGDNQLRWLDPREWVINPGAVSHWGTAVMAAMNNPFSNAGRMLADRINGISIPQMTINAPRLAMAAGGQVGTLQPHSAGATINLTINTTQPVDDTFIRRKIIPELNRYAGLKA